MAQIRTLPEVIALPDRVVCFEMKPGPWKPASDKEFVSWAPQKAIQASQTI